MSNRYFDDPDLWEEMLEDAKWERDDDPPPPEEDPMQELVEETERLGLYPWSKPKEGGK